MRFFWTKRTQRLRKEFEDGGPVPADLASIARLALGFTNCPLMRPKAADIGI